MTLIVEDGTGVEFANSYQSILDARALALKIGVLLTDDDSELGVLLIKGGMYLQQYEPSLCGSRTTAIQGLMFPRSDIYLRDIEIGENEIPNDLKVAQLLAVDDFSNGGNPWGTKDNGQRIASHSVDGAVSQSYFDSGKSGNSYSIPRIDSLMNGFCGGGVSSASINNLVKWI